MWRSCTTVPVLSQIDPQPVGRWMSLVSLPSAEFVIHIYSIFWDILGILFWTNAKNSNRLPNRKISDGEASTYHQHIAVNQPMVLWFHHFLHQREGKFFLLDNQTHSQLWCLSMSAFKNSFLTFIPQIQHRNIQMQKEPKCKCMIRLNRNANLFSNEN